LKRRQAIALDLLKRFIRLKFPHVQPITTAEFAQALAGSTPSQLLVLDARSEAEYRVSHFIEAQRVDSIADGLLPPTLQNVSKETPIIVYCSVGYRSAKVAQQINKAGFQNVSNLEGGLFQWANEGRAAQHIRLGTLVHEGHVTSLVHPFNWMWGMLLDKSHRL
jgi:rhodanese-related sulfurtransferase